MKEYFQLQFKILNRKIIELGLPILIVYILLPIVFILFSYYLFEKVKFASYIYGLIAFNFILKLNDHKRNDFLKSIFDKKKYQNLRIIENIIICIPFTFFLVYKKLFVFLIILNLSVIIITLFNFKTNINITIPTPFSKKPFEFVVGFRKTFYMFPIAYFLTYISISVGNFKLGVFSILLIGITCFSYYSKIENEYFVWNFNLSAKKFLLEKIKTCLIYFSLLNLPIVIALSISFFNKTGILIVFFLLCCIYLLTIIFAKYSNFPNEIDILQGILIVLSFVFPLMLFIIIPLFYSQSIKKLNMILK